MSAPHEQLDAAVDQHRDELCELACALHDDPELAYEEHRAVARIARLLEQHGGEVERPFGGLDTAFRARRGAGAGPCVAILAEYDALPEIGHACGHNLIAGAAVGAWLALRTLGADLGGTVDLLGTPAEEGGGGKIRLIEAGAFAGVDGALMFHPFDQDLLMHRSLANLWLDMTFAGTPAHAAVAPWEGRSALTACMDTFRLIDGQRVHFPDGVRVHGFITHGGDAVNIIPERAAASFSLRAATRDELGGLCAVAERCARGAALAAGVTVTIEERQGYLDMRNNEPLARRFGEHLTALGRTPQDQDPAAGAGSIDMGDVSHQIPAIHPWLAICDQGETLCHERDFALAARSARGLSTMVVAAKAMARLAYDLIAEPALAAAAQSFFDAREP